LVIRGGALRTATYGAGALLGAATAYFLLHGLSVADFGRFATVAALLAVVSTLSDAGLTAVGVRELAVVDEGRKRDDLLGSLVALRLALASAAVVVAVAFAVIVGYDRVTIEGVVLGGIGVLLVNTQATMMVPLSVDLRIGRVALAELLKYTVTFAAVAFLSLAGASLLPYFAVQILVGLVVLLVTPILLRSTAGIIPRLDRVQAKRLLRNAAPVGIALALNVLYLRLLVVMVSLETDAHETGLYGTAFRVIDLLVAIPPMIVGVAIPLLAVAGSEDRERFSVAVQRMIEAIVVGALGLALVVSVLAEPVLQLLGGSEYAAAASMLQIQAWALVPLSVGSVLSVTLLALNRQRAIATANGVAVVVVVVAGAGLIAAYGGEGAAVAGIVAESALLLALGAAIARFDRGLLPRLRFFPKPLGAVAAGLATLAISLPPWVAGLVAGLVFAVVAVGLRAVPPEIVLALRRRAPGDPA
jgi:O-antigen/teichoic acid export membrane protein